MIRVKVLPFPSSLDRLISPPKSLESSLLMESPSPVPPYLRCVDPSACWKASKTIWIFSLAIPMPVSVTLKYTLPWSLSLEMSSDTFPSEVNFSALESRFLKICSTRSLSVYSVSISRFFVVISSSRFFSFAISPKSICISCVISLTGTV